MPSHLCLWVRPASALLSYELLLDEVCLAVAGRTADAALGLSDCALAVSGRVFDVFLDDGGEAGSHWKNSYRSVLTVSGHSIMTM